MYGLTLEQLKAVLPEVIDALPLAEAAVVNALFWECLSPAEVAEQVGIHRSTVARIRDRAFDRIRSLVGDDD